MLEHHTASWVLLRFVMFRHEASCSFTGRSRLLGTCTSEPHLCVTCLMRCQPLLICIFPYCCLPCCTCSCCEAESRYSLGGGLSCCSRVGGNTTLLLCFCFICLQDGASPLESCRLNRRVGREVVLCYYLCCCYLPTAAVQQFAHHYSMPVACIQMRHTDAP